MHSYDGKVPQQHKGPNERPTVVVSSLTCLVSVAERKENRGAREVEGIAQAALEVALIAPVQEAKVATVDYEPRWAGISLNHITKFWMGIFEAGRRMRVDGIHQEFVKVGGL